MLLLVITLIWGGTFMFTKLGIEDCPPSLYILFRFTIAFTISVAVFRRHLLKMKKQTFWHGIVLGLFFGGGFLLQTYGLKYTSVSKSAFITGIAVVLVPFAYWLVERKKPLFWSRVGVVIATIGLWLFTNPAFGEFNPGDLITLISTLFWAFYITYMDVFTRGRNNFSETAQLVTLQFVSAAPIALLGILMFEMDELTVNFSPTLIISLIYNGILASFLVTLIHTSIQRYTTPVKAGLIFSLEPVIASLVAMMFLGEVLGLRGGIGAGIMLLGVLASEAGAYIFRKPAV